MNPVTTSAFGLPERLSAKADPSLIGGDERHFAAIAQSLDEAIAELSDRLAELRGAPGGLGREAMERDAEIHRLTARLRTLRRFGLDLCLGRGGGGGGAARGVAGPRGRRPADQKKKAH
ncbi:AAA family ATPase, partial [Streptomyces goshikiensis]